MFFPGHVFDSGEVGYKFPALREMRADIGARRGFAGVGGAVARAEIAFVVGAGRMAGAAGSMRLP